MIIQQKLPLYELPNAHFWTYWELLHTWSPSFTDNSFQRFSMKCKKCKLVHFMMIFLILFYIISTPFFPPRQTQKGWYSRQDKNEQVTAWLVITTGPWSGFPYVLLEGFYGRGEVGLCSNLLPLGWVVTKSWHTDLLPSHFLSPLHCLVQGWPTFLNTLLSEWWSAVRNIFCSPV